MSSQLEFHRWLRNALFKTRVSPLTRLVLRNAASGNRSGEIEEFEIPSDLEPDAVTELADSIIATAQRDADASGTKLQSYTIMAYDAGDKPGGRHRIRLRGEGEEDESGEERPDRDGIISQMMRHNEALMRMATMGAQATISHLTRQLEASQNTVAKLTEQKAQAQELLETVKSRQVERELMVIESEAEQTRKNALVTTVVSKMENLLPIILSKLGGGGAKMLSDRETRVLKSFVGQLSQEQIMAMAGHLSMEQQIALMSMIKELNNEAS